MTIDDAGARRLIAAAAAVALLLRLLFALIYWVDRPLTHDEHEYLSLARGLASGAGFVYDDAVETGTAQRFGRAPGYPVFLALLDAGRPVPSSTPARVKVAQSLVGAATAWLLGLIALSAAGPRAGIVAAALAAIYPPLIAIPAYAFSETLYSFVAFATMFVLQRAVDRASPTAARHGRAARARGRPARRRRGAGSAGDAAVHAAGFRLAAVPAAPGARRGADDRRDARRRPVDGAQRPRLRSAGADRVGRGRNVLDRQQSAGRGEGDLAANLAIKEAELALRQRHAGLTAEQMEPIYYREALAWIAEEPGRWLLLELRKAFYTIVPIGPSYAVHSPRYRFASIVPYLMVLPFAVPGAIRLWRSARRPTPLFLLAGSAILMCLVFFPQERFRLPVIDPALLVAAAAMTGRSAVVSATPRVLVVVPTYNERDNLPVLARGVLAHVGFRMMVVDDGSPDGTGAIADGLAAEHPGRVEVMHRTGPRGLGRSYIDGLRRAIAYTDVDLVCQMDADLSHNPEYLPALAAATRRLRRRHRLALSPGGQRRQLAAPPHLSQRVRQPLHPDGDAADAERLHQRLPMLAARVAGAAAARGDGVGRLRVSRRDALRGRRAGCRFGEVPIIFVERRQGQSKVSGSVLMESLITPWRLIFRKSP